MKCPPRLAAPAWQKQMQADLAPLRPIVQAAIARRSRGEKHPIEDFLWEYYGLRPGKLLQWRPGVRLILEEADADAFPESAGYSAAPGGGRWLDPERIPPARLKSFGWICNLLEQTRHREPFYGCLGLHEWAMVYEADDIRHPVLPLRLSHAETRRVVETLPMRCSHYDAFRFFSASARKFNPLPLQPDARPQQEQPACLHANMDLLKWCLKATPWISTRLLTRAFLLAREARIVDMRASPYDVTPLGETPIPIETPGGRQTYVRLQRGIADAAAPIRDALIKTLTALQPQPQLQT